MPHCFECKAFAPGLIEICPECNTPYPKIFSPVKGTWKYKDFILQQHKDILTKFPLFLQMINPARVLEIGTGHGGFSLFLRNSLNDIGLSDAPIKSFDIIERECYGTLRSHGVEVSVQSLFDSSYSELEERELIGNYVQSPGISLVLCDGGNKRMEFNILSSLLKEGDFIMATIMPQTFSILTSASRGKDGIGLNSRTPKSRKHARKTTLPPSTRSISRTSYGYANTRKNLKRTLHESYPFDLVWSKYSAELLGNDPSQAAGTVLFQLSKLSNCAHMTTQTKRRVGYETEKKQPEFDAS